jgi:predicted DNA-binding WGR domain protein
MAEPAPECLLYRTASGRQPRFYRVEIAMNLFCEISVLREWGMAGRPGHLAIAIFANLRDASLAADRARLAAQRRGYVRAV